jgi:ankyrin repeat protein
MWDEECPLTKCALNLIKQHLPPPLPLKPKAKKIECAPMKSSSTSDTSVSRPPSEKGATNDATSAEQAPTMKPSQPAAPLIDLARMQYWESVVKQASRRGAKYRDLDGLYPLHWAVSGGPPLEVVQALLDAYPSAARKTDKEGSTALHFATHYSASPVIIDALLKVYPKAAMMQDRYGRTPLYHAVDKGAGIDVLSKLLSSDPSVTTSPCLPHGQRNIPMSRAVAQRTPLFMVWSAVLLDRQCRHTRRGKKWDKAQLLLESAYVHFRKTKPPFQHPYAFLFAAIALDVYLPEDIVPIAVTMHPEQLQMKDEYTGRLPLSQAASALLLSRRRADDLIALLLEKHPIAVESVDFQGKSALHVAVESGKSWAAGVHRLVGANPDAIRWVAQSSGLSPAFAAAKSEVTIVHTPAPKTVTDENPLGLLTSKEKEILRRRRRQLLEPTIDEEASTETEQVSTVLQLLLLDPSVVPVVTT